MIIYIMYPLVFPFIAHYMTIFHGEISIAHLS